MVTALKIKHDLSHCLYPVFLHLLSFFSSILSSLPSLWMCVCSSKNSLDRSIKLHVEDLGEGAAQHNTRTKPPPPLSLSRSQGPYKKVNGLRLKL